MPSSQFVTAYLCGLGQAAFSGRPMSGVLVLAAATLIAPWSALGAALGCLAGTLAARRFAICDETSWTLGLAGYNPAILGFFWSGVLAAGGPQALLFLPALAVCIVLDVALKRVFARLDLPPMALAAVLTAWGSALAFRLAGWEFWTHAELLPTGPVGLAVAVALVAAVLMQESVPAFLQASVLAVAVGLGAGLLFDDPVLGPTGLWAFAVLPATFATFGIFVAGLAAGAWAGLAAGLIAAAIWVAWVATSLVDIVQPLLMPCFVSIWLALLAVRRRFGAALLNLSVQAAADCLTRARLSGRPAVVLTGAGVSTASGIPDYISGAWLDPDVPTGNYAYSRFLESALCRQQYWEACDRFRTIAQAGLPNHAHMALGSLEHGRYISAVITQNVDGYHQAAGSRRVVELHGNINGIRCIDCDRRDDWPGRQQWREQDLACPSCGGRLKPSVVALEENLLPGVWDTAVAAVERCGVLMVVGTQVAISTAVELLSQARRNGAQVVFVNLGPVAAPVLPGDILIDAPAEEALPTLCTLLGCDTAPNESYAAAMAAE